MPPRLDPEVFSAALDVLTQGAERRRDPPAAPHPLLVQSLVVSAFDVQPDLLNRACRAATLAIQTFAPDCVELWRALRLPGWDVLPTDPKRVDEILSGLERRDPSTEAQWPEAKLAHEVYRRVTSRVASRAVQDVRIDFTRPAPAGARSDQAVVVARALAIDAEAGTLPEQVTLHLGSFAPSDAEATLGVLAAFVEDWADHRRQPPTGLQITVDDTSDRVIGALAPLLDHLERQVGWPLGTVALEWLVDRPGPLLAHARYPISTSVSRGRLRSVRIDHAMLTRAFGTAVADLVLAVGRAQLAETTIQLSSGRSGPVHDGGPEAASAAERADRFALVHEAWRSTSDQTRSFIGQGIAWGTDEDPRQLPARWAALTTQARISWPSLVERMAETMLQCLDRPSASVELLWRGQALFTDVLRYVDAGALDARELEPSGIDAEDLAGRSFALMVQRRRS